jgi:hypothetical protein
MTRATVALTAVIVMVTGVIVMVTAVSARQQPQCAPRFRGVYRLSVASPHALEAGSLKIASTSESPAAQLPPVSPVPAWVAGAKSKKVARSEAFFPSIQYVSRLLRFIPDGGSLVEVTCRCLHSRLLLRPGHRLNQIIVGALARSKRYYGVRIVAFFFGSNHFHLLLEVDDARQLSRFMCHFTSKLAKEVGRLTGWREKVFGRRYQAIIISPEEAAQRERLFYVLSQGAKEGLVDSPLLWPGVHAVRALLGEEELTGYWFDRTKEYAARHRREDFDPLKYATPEILTLDPLPCWKDVPAEERRRRVAGLVAEIDAQAADRRERTGIPSMGAAALLAQDPLRRPLHSKRSPAPFCHAASKDWRQSLRAFYKEFVDDFRRAAELLRKNNPTSGFRKGASRRPCLSWADSL